MRFDKLFITGGAGYVGSSIVPDLLNNGYQVTVYDTLFFRSIFCRKSDNLKIIKGDIRDIDKLKQSCNDHQVFINLACISNDSSFELDASLSTQINFDAFEPMVIAAKKMVLKDLLMPQPAQSMVSQTKKMLKRIIP